MNIRLHLSEVAGSNEKVIEVIERSIKDKRPFGLKCQRSAVVFIPSSFTAYWLWSDGSAGPIFETNNVKAFVDCIKMQYLSHKELVGMDKLLEIAKILKDGQQQKRLASI